MRTLGARLCHASAGICEIEIPITDSITQHNGFVHAGVQSSVADHACGVATASLLKPGQSPLSIEFKINLLRPCRGDRLWAKANVIRRGKTMAVVECDVFSCHEGAEAVQTAKMLATIAIVEAG